MRSKQPVRAITLVASPPPLELCDSGEGSIGSVGSNLRMAPPRCRDSATADLGVLASEWEGLHRAYQGSANRAKHVENPALRGLIDEMTARALALRDEIGKAMARTLRRHPLYSWMAAHRGFPKAVHTARLLAAIGDPLRFPGRVCAEGHHLPADCNSNRCPLLTYGDDPQAPAACGAPVGEGRRGTGVRSLWHYCGLHVVDGRLARQRKGQQGTWNPALRGALLMPDVGIAAQLIRMRVEPWRSVYDESKARMARARGVGLVDESDAQNGPALALVEAGGAAESGRANAMLNGRPLRPFEVESRARIIAVKSMLGDMLGEWKRLAREEPAA